MRRSPLHQHLCFASQRFASQRAEVAASSSSSSSVLWRLALIAALALTLLISPSSSAYADEVAPDLEGSDLRVKAQVELKKLVSMMPPNDQQRLAGVYGAFDPSNSDPRAQVACDDDGDYVIVVSDAMLRLVAGIARATSYDEANNNNNNGNNGSNSSNSTHKTSGNKMSGNKVEEYASFLAESQIQGQRLLPPPAGFFNMAEKPAPLSTYDERLSETLSFILARELTHLRAGDLICPRPTATKESGDDTWTSAEQKKAIEIAAWVYPGRQLARDTEATVHVLDLSASEKGAIAFLRFFAQLEAQGRKQTREPAAASPPRKPWSPTYQTHHPMPEMRLAVVKQAASAHRESAPSE